MSGGKKMEVSQTMSLKTRGEKMSIFCPETMSLKKIYLKPS